MSVVYWVLVLGVKLLRWYVASQVAQRKESTCQCRRCRRHRRRGFDRWLRKIPWRGKWQPIPVFLPGKSHEQRSLAGHSPWGRKESGTTEHAHFLSKMLCITESLSRPCDLMDCGLHVPPHPPPGSPDWNGSVPHSMPLAIRGWGA